MLIERNIASDHRKWRGAILMGAAAALFPVKDGFKKALSGSISALEAGLINFAVQAVVAFIWFSTHQMQTTKKNQPLKLSTLLIFQSVFQILAIIFLLNPERTVSRSGRFVLF